MIDAMKADKRRSDRGFLEALRNQRLASVPSIVAILAEGLCFGGLVVGGLAPLRLAAADKTSQPSSLGRPYSARDGATSPAALELRPVVAHRPKRANFERESASDEARHVADWVVDSGDNCSMPFAIVDKADAKVFVFDIHGRLRGAAPALLGLARGDDAVPGIGDRELSSIGPEERTTPAGRFVAALGQNSRGKEILWVDYDGAVSMHPVITTKPEERRAQRLATPTPFDNRISFGCINVPAKFYKNVVRTVFGGTNGVVYVLPETKSAREVFPSYDVDERARSQDGNQPVPAPVSSSAAQQ